MGLKAKYIGIIRASLLGTCLVTAGTISFFLTERVAKEFIERYQPELEKNLSKKLGHPFLIGQYNGLRPWGVSFGPTKFLAGYKDKSTAEVSDLKIQFAPVSSVIRRQPILLFTLSGAKVNLTRNKDGSYWVLGSSETKTAANINLQFRLKEILKVSIDQSDFLVKPNSKLNLNLFSKQAKGKFLVDFPENGSINLEGSGNWNKLNFQAKVGLKKFDLTPLAKIFPLNMNVKTKGILDGDITLGVKNGGLNCNGGISISDLTLMGSGLKESVTSQKTIVNCQNNFIELPPTQFGNSFWTGTLSGGIPIANTDNLKLITSISMNTKSTSSFSFNAVLPFEINERGFVPGNLSANYKVASLALNSLSKVADKSISGKFSGDGTLKGPLDSLSADFSFVLDNPQFNRIRLQEKWRGEFVGSSSGGGVLQMSSSGAAIPSTIIARLTDEWIVDDMKISRLGGEIVVNKKPNRYEWKAKNFRLDRLEIAIPPQKRFKRIFGQLSGKGNLDLNPLAIDGKISLEYPRFSGLKLQEAKLQVSFAKDNYSLGGELFPIDSGQISMNLNSRKDGSFSTKAEFKKITPSWLINSSLQLPNINVEIPLPNGNAKDLGEFALSSKGESLDSQIRKWIRSVRSVSKFKQSQEEKQVINPNDIRGYVDGVIQIQGPSFSELNVDLTTRGKLWLKNQNDLEPEPFTATLRGPLRVGIGEFSIKNIPFSLLSLFSPSPSGLSGMFGFVGKYRLGKKNTEITADLIFNKVALDKELLILNRGMILFSQSVLKVDIELQNISSSDPITLVGQIPFLRTSPLDIRIDSHGDGISFLDALFKEDLIWKSGNVDLSLLITGTIDEPRANGFIVLSDGESIFKDKTISEINGIMIFDFYRVEVQRMKARVGENGIISAGGDIALFKEGQKEKNPLLVELKNLEIQSSLTQCEISSKIFVNGSLIRPILAGELTIKDGSISPRRTKSSKNIKNNSDRVSKVNSWQEQNWSREKPLALTIRDESDLVTKAIDSAIPKGLSFISFDDFRLNIGPNFRVISKPVTSFDIKGFLELNGAFDPNIKARGFVEFLNGRVNLFTTTFLLDKRSTNTAIFVPDMGLVPFIDLKLTTKVPDAVRNASNISSSSEFTKNGSGAFGIGGSRFINIELSGTGPADRIKDSYQLRSVPALPEKELLSLIGGSNWLPDLEGGDMKGFADILNRTYVSPILGDISGAFSDRIQFALYPAYINAAASYDSEVLDNQSDSKASGLSSQQAWVTEMGVDLTDRINFSISATPNREDIPSQGNLTFQLNQNFSVLGSFDQNGDWQSQLEIFIRY